MDKFVPSLDQEATKVAVSLIERVNARQGVHLEFYLNQACNCDSEFRK